jgi:hypothetical protein
MEVDPIIDHVETVGGQSFALLAEAAVTHG